MHTKSKMEFASGGEYKRTDPERKPVNRGPIAPETLAENMAKPAMDEIEGEFNSWVRKWAGRKIRKQKNWEERGGEED